MEQLEIEKKWQAYWKKHKIFTPQVDTSKKKFFGTVPYPYANSALHIGHGRTFTAADIMIRFQRLLGKNVLYPLGFHISGTPVLAVADGIKRGDKKQISLTKEAMRYYESDEKKVDELVMTFTQPKKLADYFSSKIEETFYTVGISVDWSKEFSTGDEGYKKFVSWQYRHLEKAGILEQGKYPILYSYVDEGAVGEDDIKDGDTEKVSIQEMTYILFKDKEVDEYFVVATLRPDALFGTTNLWVDPSHTILKVQVNDQVWLVNKGSFKKIKYQFDKVKIISEHKGSEFLGRTYITPLINREIPSAAANFIVANHGTGLVYSSPAGSPHDFLGLQEAKQEGRISPDVVAINSVVSKDKKGNVLMWEGSCPAESIVKKYNITSSTDERLEEVKQELYKIEHYGGIITGVGEEWEGLPVKHAKERVFEALLKANLGGTLYETSRRAQTRAGNEVIVANLQGQWFLNYSDEKVKQKAYDLLENMTYYPEILRNTQKGYLAWVQKRPCARKRGLGTPLPQDPEWVIEPLSDSTIYPLYYVISGFINDGRLDLDDLNDDVLNYFYFGGEKPAVEGIEELKAEVEYWGCFDFRYTAAPHMSNHLSFLIYHYSLLFKPDFQPRNITIGGLLIRDGQKISKSKGNGIPLIQIRETYGADLYRLYVAVGTSYDAEFDFRDEEIFQLKKKFDRWKELMFAAKSSKPLEYLEDIDSWLISRFYTRASQYLDAMSNMNPREAYIQILYEVLNEISHHSRRTSEERSIQILRMLYEDYARLMTPVVPHVCEELLDGEATHAIFELKEHLINKKVEELEGMTQDLLKTISYQKDRRGLTQLKKITCVQAKSERFLLFDRIKELLKETKEFKKILPVLLSEFDDKKFITTFVPKTLGSGLQAYLAKDKEKTYLESVKAFLEKEFNCVVDLVDADEFEAKQQSLPGSPGVLIE